MSTDREPDYRDETKGFARAVVFVLVLASSIMAVSMCTAHGAECRVAWNPQTDATSWKVWRGTDLLATVQTNEAVVDLPVDRLSTLTVTAHRDGLASTHSAPITVQPVTPQWSPDLRVWIVVPKTFFIELLPKAYFRFSYPLTP
jgi:hypothetical protein